MLKELIQQEDELSKKLGEVRRAITEEKTRLAEEQFGVSVGSIVSDRQGNEYRVTRIMTMCSGKPWLEGNPKKKDGTFGVARRNIYSDWNLVSPNNQAKRPAESEDAGD